MNTLDKIQILGAAGKFDICASTASKRKITVDSTDRIGDAAASGICHSFTPDGRCVSLFKVLYTNACSFDCKYCMNPCADRRVSFQAEELASAFMNLYLRNYVEGFFLSSGIAGDPEKTMDNILDTTRLVREKHGFRGYVHLKIIPGATLEQVKQATELADRVSINVEQPSKGRLNEVSSTKDMGIDIVRRQRWIHNRMETFKKFDNFNNLPAGHTTQFCLGASGESDAEVFNMVKFQYQEVDLKRAYFSAFTPIEGTSLEGQEKVPLSREHRLYQMDWLYRVYKFDYDFLTNAFDDNGFLHPCDPKLTLAREYFGNDSIDVNEARFDDLLKIPGIGPTSAKRIVELRGEKEFSSYGELQRLGVAVKRARPFISIAGAIQKTLGVYA